VSDSDIATIQQFSTLELENCQFVII